LSAHATRDPHFGASAALSSASSLSVVSTSGLYQWYFTVGMTSESQLLHAASFLCVAGAGLLVAAFFHSRSLFTGSLAASSWQALVNHHLGAMLGTASIAWAGHIVHVALHISQGAHVDALASFTQLCHPLSLAPFLGFNWASYAMQPDGIAHVFGSADAASGNAILTFLGGLLPASDSLYLTDIAHHHLAVGILAVLLGSVANGINFSAGLLPESLHYQLAWALAALGTASSYAAQHIDALPPYAYLDKVSHAGLYTHHQYIAGFFLCGAFAHGAIYLVRDDSYNSPGWFAKLVMQHRAFIISHLSYVSLFLGFHTLGLYVHNDVMQAFACPEKMIGIAPVFAQWIQVAHGNTLGFSISSGDVLVHHGIALGLHVTTLILLKAALNGRSSKLFPDKVAFGSRFPCDGPGRGGT
jgi:photosystem I P700 chlorophyll a apoprotein A2